MSMREHMEARTPSATPPGHDELICRYIEDDPARPGPIEARITQVGVPIWALIGYLRAAGGDVEMVARDYEMPPDAVRAAIAFYRVHAAAIDARIAANTRHTR
jgi:uncharacterized protein (DUF433 family)